MAAGRPSTTTAKSGAGSAATSASPATASDLFEPKPVLPPHLRGRNPSAPAATLRPITTRKEATAMLVQHLARQELAAKGTAHKTPEKR